MRKSLRERVVLLMLPLVLGLIVFGCSVNPGDEYSLKQGGETLKAESIYGGFTISGGVLKDANGNDFVIRGVNNPHAWYDGPAYDALTSIAGLKANTIRIVWQLNGSAARLEQIIQRCIALKMIAIPELHDATGKDDTGSLNACVNYWIRSDVKAVLNKYTKYVIINIANEWMGSWNKGADWANAYKSAVATMRNNGLHQTILVDSAGYGQEWASVNNYAQTVFNSDPDKNVLFAIHMYGQYGTAAKVQDCIHTLKSKNIPFIIGEFGWTHSDGDVDELSILQECKDHGVGYLPWSWKGNSGGVEYLDLSTSWTSPGLTAWGNTAFNSANGIKATAKVCTVFETTSSSKSSVISSSATSKPVSSSSSKPASSSSSKSSTATAGNYAVNYTITTSWTGGATVNVTLKNNTAAAVNGWTLKWNFPGNQTITQIWSATHSQSGTSVTAKNVDYNTTISPNGGTQSFGFNLSFSGANGKPVSFTLNGVPCSIY